MLVPFDLPERILKDQPFLKANRDVIKSDEGFDHESKKAPSLLMG